VTGFIVENEEQAIAAVSKLERLSRSTIRQRFERRFTARRMAEEYVSLYHRLAVKARPALRVVT
jgi:glycosyltransferase involved in cell wall biosynthesis